MQCHRVDREVATDEIVLEGVSVDDLGLAGVRVVRVCAVGGDLHHPVVDLGADSPEGSADAPCRMGAAAKNCLRRVGASVGGEVKVVSKTTHEGVADGPTDEIKIVTCLRKDLAQFSDQRHLLKKHIDAVLEQLRHGHPRLIGGWVQGGGQRRGAVDVFFRHGGRQPTRHWLLRRSRSWRAGREVLKPA